VSVTVLAVVLLNRALICFSDTMFYGFVILSAVGTSHGGGKLSSVIKFWIWVDLELKFLMVFLNSYLHILGGFGRF